MLLKLERAGLMDQIAWNLDDFFFERCYRIDKPTFRYILESIKPELLTKPNEREDELDDDLALSRAISWLRGGSYLDICRLHRVKTYPTRAPCNRPPIAPLATGAHSADVDIRTHGCCLPLSSSAVAQLDVLPAPVARA